MKMVIGIECENDKPISNSKLVLLNSLKKLGEGMNPSLPSSSG